MANDAINLEENLEFVSVEDYLSNNLINTLKINHTLDETLQNCQSYKAYLFLNDGMLNIINRKPCLDKTASAESKVSLSEMKALANNRNSLAATIQSKVECENGIVYQLSKSSSCMAVTDITGMVFGGMTSRFWILRKHFNCLSYKQL